MVFILLRVAIYDVSRQTPNVGTYCNCTRVINLSIYIEIVTDHNIKLVHNGHICRTIYVYIEYIVSVKKTGIERLKRGTYIRRSGAVN